MHIYIFTSLFVKSQLSCQIYVYRNEDSSYTSMDNKKNNKTGHGEGEEKEKEQLLSSINVKIDKKNRLTRCE